MTAEHFVQHENDKSSIATEALQVQWNDLPFSLYAVRTLSDQDSGSY